MTSRSNDAKAQDLIPHGAKHGLHILVVGLLASGCTSPTDDDTSIIASEVSVSAYQSSGCSTSVVIGLSKQIADEIACMSPSSLQRFSPSANIVFTSNAVLPYLGAPAKTALGKVGAGYSVQINSAFRTVAQQYLLYRWYQQGRCGITAAASPGRSNHQSGRALDLANYSSRITPMRNQGWSHSVPGDPVHFDHGGSPDIRGMDVKAFQRLWNRNNPNDKISEDGSYGPQTEARLKQAPATGFTTGAVCANARETTGADVLSVDGPDRIAAGGHTTFSITVQNNGTVDWPATTRLMVMNSAESELYDSSSWTSRTEVGPIKNAIKAGEKGVIDVEVAAPVVTEETAAQTELVFSDGTTMFGSINLSVTITPNGDDDISNEGDDTHDDAPEVSGGCNASGNASWLMLLAPALVVLRRRRR
ncbi:MAG: D-alanyl-D-alanine carboxypeptidase family protein [Deltaproteobacteria bacterium]|nr:D-alanyl-D-alanine carboxypeptidase family protein [Deltaproteobacteria bacterium]